VIAARTQLLDGHGRAISDLRLSVTDRCGFRCRYCMPAEGMHWLDRADLLTFEEIERLMRVLVQMGIRDVRLTGGEPLVRRQLPRLASMLAAIPGLHELALTTNGYQLERDAHALVHAGVTRFNVSVDSLQRERFSEMTRRDVLDKVLRGLATLASFPQAHPIKVNALAMRGFTETEVIPFARFAREHPYEVRFIEFMPLDADHAWTPDDVLSGEEIRAAIHAVYPLEPEPRTPSATARTFRFADGRGRIGFINPVSEPFCADCNSCAPACSRCARRTCAPCCAAEPTTTSSRPWCAVRCGARSSSTTSAIRASCSRTARCRPLEVDGVSGCRAPLTQADLP
jgi:cyclic pyranopterin phosphate synthase